MKTILALAALILSSMAFAATEESQVVTTTADTEISKSSAQNRADDHVVITGQLDGHGAAGVAGVGINVGFYLTPSSLLQIEMSGGNVTDEGDHGYWLTDWYDYTTKKEGYAIGLHFKHFVGNSFYFKTGSDYRSFKFKETYNNSWWNSNTSNDRQRSFSGESITAAISIGNQWQFGAFTLGCDWIGLQLPIASRIYDERFSGATTSYDAKDNKDDQEQYVTRLTATLLRLSIGASF